MGGRPMGLVVAATLLFCCALTVSAAPPKWIVHHEQTDDSQWGDHDSPPIRYSHATVAYQDTIVLTHGYFYDKHTTQPAWLDDTWSFSIPAKKWTKIYPKPGTEVQPGKDAPHGRYGHSGALYDGGLYVFGGTDGGARLNGNNGYIPGNDFNDFWRFDLTTHEWEEIKKKDRKDPWPPSANLHSSAVVGDYLYTYGGIGRGDTWRFSFKSGTWKEVKDRGAQPGVRYGHGWAASESGFYIHGGRVHTGAKSGILEDLWHFDAAAQKWEEIKTPQGRPEGRLYHTMVLVGRELVLTGGSVSSPAVTCSNDVWAYGLDDGEWLQSTGLPYEVYHHTSVVNGGQVFVFGGHKCGKVSRHHGSYFNSLIGCELGDRARRETPTSHAEL